MKKLLFTLLAYLPIATLVLFFVAIVQADTAPLVQQRDMFAMVAVISVLLLVVMTIVSMIIFISTVCKRTDFHSGKKVFWVAMFVFYSIFTYPIFLHKYILRKEVFAESTGCGY